MESERLRELDRIVLGEIWTTDEAWRNLVFLCDDLGHRFAGSQQERRAAEFLAERMRAYGLENVRLETFPIATWERGPCHLAVVEPLERELPAIAMPYCPTARLEAEVVDVGEGELPDFERLASTIPGRIVLTDAETNRPGERKSHRTDKFNWAIQRGAVAVLFVNQNPGQLHITGSLTARNPNGWRAVDREAPIPGLGVTYETGSFLRRLAERGRLRLRIATENRTRDAESANVIGEIPGYRRPEEIVLVGGHYDGHDIAHGASDDGAGTVVGLEVGRALARVRGRLARTVRVICFGAEELGLLGAYSHAAQAAARGERIRFVLNLDGAGRGTGGQEQLVLSGLPELVPYFRDIARALPYDFVIRDELNAHSDHFPFALRGIPNATLSSRDATTGMIGRGWGHTEADTLDKVTLRSIQLAAALAARLVIRLSEDDAFPGRQRTPEEVRQQLADAGLLERVRATEGNVI
ncbi:MAG: M20/M25/M40 family metallo-hydrolase [Thermomicrobium sp.]|nr:M20/M25/M40 family metallo-hydrolase [Thermomicrobium sp.]